MMIRKTKKKKFLFRNHQLILDLAVLAEAAMILMIFLFEDLDIAARILPELLLMITIKISWKTRYLEEKLISSLIRHLKRQYILIIRYRIILRIFSEHIRI